MKNIKELIDAEKSRLIQLKRRLVNSPKNPSFLVASAKAYVRGYADGKEWISLEDTKAIAAFNAWVAMNFGI